MPAQFYISPSHLQAITKRTHFLVGDEFPLNETTAHHLTTVLRARSGDEILCFDGAGQRFAAVMLSTTKRAATVKVISIETTQPHPTATTGVALSLLKGQAMDRAIQLATELGASQITLVNAMRSNVVLSKERSAKKLTHWERIVIGACEQCGRTQLPSLATFSSWQSFLDSAEPAQLIALDMDAPPLAPADINTHTDVMIGPEGGWHDAERELFVQAKIRFCRLTATTLRAETTPGIALALIEQLRG